MVPPNLSIPVIRECQLKDVVVYFDKLRRNHSDAEICQSLFEAYTHHEYLQPDRFALFLSWSSSVDVIALYVRHGPALFVRKQGIRQFGKVLADPKQWLSAWEALGGTEGLTRHFAERSVVEVVAFTDAIGHCNRGQKVTAREKTIEEFLHALLPSSYPDAKVKSRDSRRIKHHYARMVPACSPAFVEQLLDGKCESNPLYRHLSASRLIKTHGDLLRKRILDSVSGDEYLDQRFAQCLGDLLYSQPSRSSGVCRVSASMAFATKILQVRVRDVHSDERWPSEISEVDVFLSIFNRSCRRRLPEGELLDVIMLGLGLLEVKPELLGKFRSRDIWSKLITRWRKTPDLYEDAIALALRLELGGSQKSIGQDFLETSKALEDTPELRWQLLRQYCQNVPKEGVDLDTSNDFSPLANQLWPIKVFYQLSNDQSIRLLRGLRRANPKFSFLQPSGGAFGASILSNRYILSDQNFNALLLSAMFQRNSVDLRRRSQKYVDRLRNDSVSAKDPLHRALLAKAASAYSIASGDLDLYGETLTWQRLYVRDPLTLRVVFARDAVMTSEGIELLSGIPQPLPEEITLVDVASRVVKANHILKTLNGIMWEAKRAPSFQEHEWTGVKSLFGAALRHRFARLNDLRKRGQEFERDSYASVLECTLKMLGEVSADLRDEAYRVINNVLLTLPPTVLANTTKVMLDAGNEKRKNQDHQLGKDSLERLPYEALLQLVRSENPELAWPLVLQTISDRPDASEWHKRLLSISFLNSLNAEDACRVVFAFAASIAEKPEEQSSLQSGAVMTSKSIRPYLDNVATVKYLAQLLEKAEFISADLAVDVLAGVFKAATNRDVLLVTLESMLGFLEDICSGTNENWRSNPAVEKMMEALDTVVPVIGNLNELFPVRQENWEEASTTGRLPEISDFLLRVPPLLNAMIRAADKEATKNLRAEFVARYLLPALRQSQAEHRKWVALFLDKHHVNLTVDDLPPTPRYLEMWTILIERYTELIPRTVLEDFNKYAIMTVDPPGGLKNLNKLLRENTERQNPGARHWLSVFGQSMVEYGPNMDQYDQCIVQYGSSGTHTLLRLIHHSRPKPLIRDGITFEVVFDMVTSHTLLFLGKYETHESVWTDFVKDLRPPTHLTYRFDDTESIRLKNSTWQRTGRLVLEKVAALVMDAKPTGEDRGRVIPSAAKLRLWLLPYPCFPAAAIVDEQCRVFAKKLVELLESFIAEESNESCWPKIAEDAFTVSGLLNTDKERLLVAFHVGGPMESSEGDAKLRISALKSVRTALAMRLIDDGCEGLSNGIRDSSSPYYTGHLMHRIERWHGSFDEGIWEQVTEWRLRELSVLST